MNETNYAKGITAQNLRIFLELWPLVAIGVADTKKTINDCDDRLIDKEDEEFIWCYFYELPTNELIVLLCTGLLQFVSLEQILDWFKQMSDSPGNIGALPDILNQVHEHFDGRPSPTKNDLKSLRPFLPEISAAFIAVQYSLYCVLYHGCFLNELIERARSGDNKALIDAIKIDTSVIGCPTAVGIISKATRLQDMKFFAKLKSAINGKKEKLKQENFQKMRLVFEVLYEAGALRLTDKQLYLLFVEELKLYTANSKGGGSDKALRKFADTYMKKNATT
ncbi:hypothetical protein C8R26_11465 [Nitrosomonas oligotropha]|uniref:Uncharacterized protein n=1 Tax=Nitrosomonas oligotropha TaxID=42354 RepID=A0A2T5HYU8_9PROT|nr:hypothetical protein [Nitrosomonas oligotropha]PTQ76746.1 hypothetical protein C8R26_11465 [Nitrosomonas oligotropha]